MAGAAALSAFMQVLFEKLAVAALDEYKSLRNVKTEFQYLSSALSSIQDLLEDAEEKQLKDKPVRGWLVKLKDVAVDIDDLLDKHTAAVQRSNLKDQKRKVSRHLSCYFFSGVFLDYKLAHKIKGFNERLDKISRERDVLGLQVLNSHTSRLEIEEKPQSSSLVDGSCVFGREEDKENIVKLLLATGDVFNNPFNVAILPVVGMGGLGKTTLAQLVYNDNRVKEHFQLRMWLCVSENFDERKLTRETLEYTLSDYTNTITITNTNTNTNTTNLNLLQEDLFHKLKGKKFLLVLDDVWNENREKWSRYFVALAAGERGSKILVTTRNENVGLIMGGLRPYYLKQLSEKDCWSLFRSCAFVNGCSSGHPKLEEIGKEIVKKLKGLPLAAKTLGSLLYSKLDEDDWKNILRSEIWELPTDQNNIMPALRLSYKHLPPHLKQCFAFCAVFHKDYVFGRDDLVQMWMALSYVQPQGRKRMEDVGYSYFDELVSRSFFQAHKGNYVMHDAIHDLAQSISIGECVRLEDKLQNDMTDKALHSSFSCSHTKHTSFVPFYRFKRLRTFLLLQGYKSRTGLIPDDLFLRLKFLRVLVLNRRDIDKVPNSIGNIISMMGSRPPPSVNSETSHPQGGEPPPVPPSPSWAQIAGAQVKKFVPSLPLSEDELVRLKSSISETIRVDEETQQMASERFQYALYGKLFGRSPPFDYVKTILLGMWRSIGTVHVSDMPNGFLLIRCETEAVKNQLLFSGPWSVQGVNLQLSPWQSCFEPAFTKLTKAMVWVQFHNLPVEFWNWTALTRIIGSFGRLLKVDKCTESLERTRFARVCLELELTCPLKRGFWLEVGDKKVFVVAMYERLPTFCYTCGMVGHGKITCSHRQRTTSVEPPMDDPGLGSHVKPKGLDPQGSSAPPGRSDDEPVMPKAMASGRSMPTETRVNMEDSGFGPWMLVTRRGFGRGRGRGGAGGWSSRASRVTSDSGRDGRQTSAPDLRHEEDGRPLLSTRGDSGRGGRGGSSQSNPRNEAWRVSNVSKASVSEVLSPQDIGNSSLSILKTVGLEPLDPTDKVRLDKGKQIVQEGTVQQRNPNQGTATKIRMARDQGSIPSPNPPLLLMSSEDRIDEDSHRMVVDEVEKALNGSERSSEDGDQDMTDSENEEEDTDMEESDDDLTLGAFQEGVRKETLARKGVDDTHHAQKKGRMEGEGSGS